jgi:hypothetical protein
MSAMTCIPKQCSSKDDVAKFYKLANDRCGKAKGYKPLLI